MIYYSMISFNCNFIGFLVNTLQLMLRRGSGLEVVLRRFHFGILGVKGGKGRLRFCFRRRALRFKAISSTICSRFFLVRATLDNTPSISHYSPLAVTLECS
jgi:hypothetical protein